MEDLGKEVKEYLNLKHTWRENQSQSIFVDLNKAPSIWRMTFSVSLCLCGISYG